MFFSFRFLYYLTIYNIISTLTIGLNNATALQEPSYLVRRTAISFRGAHTLVRARAKKILPLTTPQRHLSTSSVSSAAYISLNGLNMSWGSNILFEDINLTLSQGKRYALVGSNGCGKSTLLKIIAGDITPDSGYVRVPNDWKIGFLDQDASTNPTDTPLDIAFSSIFPLYKAWRERKELFELIDACEGKCDDETGLRIAELEHVLMDNDAYTLEARAKRILRGLGVDESMQKQSLYCLSGGFRLKSLFGSILVPDPSILLLDEPNNHLDSKSLSWLADFLVQEYKGLLVFTSHDQNFVSKVATHILDIDYHRVIEYPGPYSSFIERKKSIEKQRKHQQATVDKRVSDIKVFIEKNRAGVRAAQAQSRIKLLERLDRPQAIMTTAKRPTFIFKPKFPSSELVFEVEDISKSYSGRQLFSKFNLTVFRYDKLAILGPNGAGKSTLLKMLVGEMKAEKGVIKMGNKVAHSYLAQNWEDAAYTDYNIFDWMVEVTSASGSHIDRVLRSCLFFHEDHKKKVSVLSGGEKVRLGLAKIMLEESNTLIFDEPTNHLDYLSILALKEALINFNGTIIFVSHSEEFIRDVANKTITIGK